MLFNQARATCFIKERNLDVLVATSPVNITYFTDYSFDLLIEEGMVNNLEACVFVPTVGAIHMERFYIVTVDGCHPLIEQGRSEPRGPGFTESNSSGQ